MYSFLFLVLLTDAHGVDHIWWCMIAFYSYHGLIEVFFILVINFIFIIWCKGHVNAYDVLIVKFNHVWTIVVKSFWTCDIICNPTMLGKWCNHDFKYVNPLWLGDWCKFEYLVIGQFIWVIDSCTSWYIFQKFQHVLRGSMVSIQCPNVHCLREKPWFRIGQPFSLDVKWGE